MTDTLDDLLSEKETLPVAAAGPVGIVCEYCPETFGPGPGGRLARGRHVKKAHPEHWNGPSGKSAKKKPPAKAPAGKAAGPGPARKPASGPAAARRKPLGESLARIFLQVGRMINSTVDPPTGAAIIFEAGALGNAIDNVIAGTFIDKPLQKGAAVAEKFEPLVPLVTLPAMIFMVSRNQALGVSLEGELREAIEDVLVQSLPLLKHRAQRQKATIDALAELKGIDPLLASSDDPIRDILNSFFIQAAPAPTPDDGEV